MPKSDWPTADERVELLQDTRGETQPDLVKTVERVLRGVEEREKLLKSGVGVPDSLHPPHVRLALFKQGVSAVEDFSEFAGQIGSVLHCQKCNTELNQRLAAIVVQLLLCAHDLKEMAEDEEFLRYLGLSEKPEEVKRGA